MRHKLLILLGIVLAHGVLAAGFTSERPRPALRQASVECVRPDETPFSYSPPLELLAFVAAPSPGFSEVLLP